MSKKFRVNRRGYYEIVCKLCGIDDEVENPQQLHCDKCKKKLRNLNSYERRKLYAKVKEEMKCNTK